MRAGRVASFEHVDGNASLGGLVCGGARVARLANRSTAHATTRDLSVTVFRLRAAMVVFAAACLWSTSAQVRAESPSLPGSNGPNQANTATPSIAALHSDFKLSVVSGATLATSAQAQALAGRAQRVSARLTTSAPLVHQDALQRLVATSPEAFKPIVVTGMSAGTASSGTGRLLVSEELAKADDAMLAYVIAREMGHVLLGHQEGNSSLSIITSVALNVLLPGAGLVKSALVFGASQVAGAGDAQREQQAADAVALVLFDAAGFSRGTLATKTHEASETSTAWERRLAGSLAALPPMPVAPLIATAPAPVAAPPAVLVIAAPHTVVPTAVPVAHAPQAIVIGPGRRSTYVPPEILEMQFGRPSGLASPIVRDGVPAYLR
jgi:hypothetical protein